MQQTQPKNTLRNRQLAQIHIAKKDLGMDDETYRFLLADVAQVNSSADLDAAGRQAVLVRFKEKGWVNKKQRGMPVNVDKSKARMIHKIGALLADMKLTWNYANGIARQMYDVESVGWCKPKQLRGIITALVNHAEKI